MRPYIGNRNPNTGLWSIHRLTNKEMKELKKSSLEEYEKLPKEQKELWDKLNNMFDELIKPFNFTTNK